MKNSVIARQSFVVRIITTIVYALLVPVFFEMENAHGEGGNFVAGIDETYTQEVDKPCKSPCPSSAEMCIAMCA